MSYQVCFCFWLLTFDQEIAENINKFVVLRFILLCRTQSPHRTYDIVPLLTDVAQAAVKEKVIRVIVATFRVRLQSSRHIRIRITSPIW